MVKRASAGKPSSSAAHRIPENLSRIKEVDRDPTASEPGTFAARARPQLIALEEGGCCTLHRGAWRDGGSARSQRGSENRAAEKTRNNFMAERASAVVYILDNSSTDFGSHWILPAKQTQRSVHVEAPEPLAASRGIGGAKRTRPKISPAPARDVRTREAPHRPNS